MFIRSLLPPNQHVWKITLWMFLPVALAYGTRIFLHMLLDSTRGPLGMGWVIICPIVCLAGAGLLALIVGFAIFFARKARHFAPALVLIVGIVLVPFLPLPPLPQPVFPEEEFFFANRGEFEQVVELARQDKLNCLENLYLDCEAAARELPVGYIELSIGGLVLVYSIPPAPLIVKFEPFDFYYPVYYFETPKERENYPQCSSIRFVRKLDEHWYLCIEEWN
ncbi:MAG: hypothetical protein ABI835_05205 [Chloroflexota bacterium]